LEEVNSQNISLMTVGSRPGKSYLMLRNGYLKFALVVLLSQIPTVLLWLADSGSFGESTIARIVLNCTMSLLAIAAIRFPFVLSKGRATIFAAVCILPIILIAFEVHVRSKITGEYYSILERFEVLIIGPLAEEVYFRGLIWNLLDQALAPASKRHRVVWIVTAVTFGLYHLGFWSQGLTMFTAQHIAGACIAGLVFGYLRLNSRGLFWPAWAHVLTNALFLIVRAI
jgi:membrane protease YdiL (CAAX protease family)